MRVPYAMRTLMNEIEQVNPKAIVTTGDPDGFGVWRKLVLDTVTTERLAELLDALEDTRIAGKGLRDGQYSVSFVTDSRADNGKAFSLDRAYAVATAAPSPIEEVVSGPTREERAREFRKMPVARLRRVYGYDTHWSKKEIVEALLIREGY